ncbi:hypothetical protein [Rhizobium phage RHph_X2_26]|nr:hypothetical protein [Rhizobium phage RHph_X2_26]
MRIILAAIAGLLLASCAHVEPVKPLELCVGGRPAPGMDMFNRAFGYSSGCSESGR